MAEEPAGARTRPARPRWWRAYRLLSLRARLIIAFLALIVTSASATIVIGNVVFGGKVLELALSKMGTGLKAAQLGLDNEVDRLKLMARVKAERLRGAPPLAAIERCGVLPLSAVLDFALVTTPNGGTLVRVGDHEAAGGDPHPWGGAPSAPPETRLCRRLELLPALLADERLGAMIERARTNGEVAGLLTLGPEAMLRLGYARPPVEGLFVAAATPLPEGGVLVLGGMINGRTGLVSNPLEFLWPDERRWHEATIFLGDRRIATTIRGHGLGTRVDDVVVEKVLHRGEVYLGSADILGESFYTAYRPLRDWRGTVIGILGLGAREEAYVDMRNQTLTLFSALIAVGMIFGFVMTYLVSSWLIRPVSELAQGMDRVARGDVDHKVRIASGDELGRLARAFNLMVRTIKERDIRLREMTQERLTQVEKQVSIGRLAAGVAHEINNPLTSVLSLSMLLRDETAGDDSRRQDLNIIVEETTRCRDIVRSLLDFARERPPEKRVIDVHQVLRDTLTLASRYEGVERLQIIEAFSEERLLVNVDARQLQQVFTNIVTNAAEASEPDSTFTIVTDEDSSGGFVHVQFIDTGKGIPKADLARVFEPFFTTKGARKGTGLGLSVSLGILQRHGGTIEIDSEEGAGTTVTVLLPRVTEEPAAVG
jgi:two-component system NtrC family sensor kinase